MLIKRQSIFSAITRVRDLPITQEQYDAWAGGALIQEAMPHLSADDREFLMTGSTPEEWDEYERELEEAFQEPEGLDYEPEYLGDDGDALASAGLGTDEDYGRFDDDRPF
jgi:hypothetical protein